MNCESFRILSLLFLAVLVSECGSPSQSGQEASLSSRPNIVYILADDLGYGDVSCYYPQGRIQTPGIDKLASQGMRFTDAHSPSSVCTPTRYAILTGDYPWRSRLARGVLRGYGRSLIEQNRHTVGTFLQQQGYHTAVIGKWHLGLDWAVKPGHEEAMKPGSYGVRENGIVTDMDPDHIDFTVPPAGGPLSRGFDYSFILPASLDMDPYCYLENDTLTEIPSGHTPGNDLHTGYTGAFWRAGRMAPSFRFDEVLPNFRDKAIAYLAERAQRRDPFFLYLALAAPHTPWVPVEEYKGKSGAGQYGDFVQMVDDEVSRVIASIDSLGLAENTIVVFASDNGPYWRPASVEKYAHRAAGPWRGMKADIFEGGHRVPFIIRWPGKIREGQVSAAPTTLTNLFATCADILDVPLPDTAARDSYSILPVLTGDADAVVSQDVIIHHSSVGHFAVRHGKWKFIEKPGSGGFSEPVTLDPHAGGPEGQLYNLETDPAEQHNLYDEFPSKVKYMQTLLDKARKEY